MSRFHLALLTMGALAIAQRSSRGASGRKTARLCTRSSSLRQPHEPGTESRSSDTSTSRASPSPWWTRRSPPPARSGLRIRRWLHGRIRSPERAGGGDRLVHHGLGHACDVEVSLDRDSVPGSCGCRKLLERVHRRAVFLPDAPRDDRCAGNGEAAHREQCEMEARHGLIAPETECYGVPRARGGESCSLVSPASPGSSYCSPRVA